MSSRDSSLRTLIHRFNNVKNTGGERSVEVTSMNVQDSTAVLAVRGGPHQKERVVRQISPMDLRGLVGTKGRQFSFEFIMAIEWPGSVQSDILLSQTG